ncbi:MAG: serpin family protein [Oscillospiraceae bacterium]|nr:serpin family protein [Oscillospiraceae bacterium]
MTPFDLLRLIGEADEQYVIPAGKQKHSRKIVPRVLAALLALVLIGSGTAVFFRSGFMGASTTDAASAVAEEAADLGARAAGTEMEEGVAEDACEEEAVVAEAPAEAAAEAPEWEMDADEAYVFSGVSLLAGAVYPNAPAWEDSEQRSAIWTENQTSHEMKTALSAFSYETAAEILRGNTASDCYSPMSLYQTLAILASGGENETASELLNLLGIEDRETLMEQVGKLYRVNYENNEATRLVISNSLWLDDEAGDGSAIGYHSDWVMEASNAFYADVYAADFSSEETPGALGSWIADHTGGMLNPSADELGIRGDTDMAVLNTIWYSAPWAKAFDESATLEDAFTTEQGDEITASFMHRTDDSGMVFEGEDYTVASIALAQGKITFVLPREGVSVEELISAQTLAEMFEAERNTNAQIAWSIPKFETTVNYDLKASLNSLGVSEVFTQNADFSRIADTPLYLSAIRQGTRFSLNEEGVEAASFTLAGLEEAAEPEEHPVVEMNLNRPFLYMVTSNDGSPLFMGVVRNPME